MSDAPRPPEPPHQPDSGVDEVTGQPIPGARRPGPDETGTDETGPDETGTDETGTDETGVPEPDAPPVETEPAVAAKPLSRRRIVGIVLVIVASGLVLLCLGTALTGFFVYRQVSEPDRSTPGVVLQQYLESMLNDRNDSRASLFTCRNSAGLSTVRQLRDDIEGKEKQFGVGIKTSPEDLNTQQSGTSATVALRLRLGVTVNGIFQEQLQNWTFSLRQESGWRVCSGERTG